MPLRPGDLIVFKAGPESVLAQVLTKPSSGLRGVLVFGEFVPESTESCTEDELGEPLFAAWAPTDPEFRKGEITQVGSAAVPAPYDDQPPVLDCVNLIEIQRRVRKGWRSHDDDEDEDF